MRITNTPGFVGVLDRSPNLKTLYVNAMYLIVQSEPSPNITSFSDLGRLVPSHLEDRALSFGQDEGQFEVSEPVWGIYVDDRRRYKIQLEGRCQAAR